METVVADDNERLLVVLAGPTASGKSALAMRLAEELQGEIVSCDSVAVYQGMDIGSAKPTPEERARVPHHMLDMVPPSVEYTAGDYGRTARAAVREIASRGRIPIVAGGTGLYLRALLDGLSDMPARNPELRERLRLSVSRFGVGWLHRLLTRLDREAASAIHPNDQPKLIRAIEVSVAARRPMSEEWQRKQPEPLRGFRVVQFLLDPPRQELYTRIDTRSRGMFEGGLLEETASLLERFGETRALGSLGYAQAAQVLDSRLSLQEAVLQCSQGHRNYAKRQLTWFRGDDRMCPLTAFGEECVRAVLDRVWRRL